MTHAELAELESFEDSFSRFFAYFTIANLILNIFLAVGFKFIWNMVTLLQFVIFMRVWQITIP